jgi:YHS domain-containing protein
MKMKHTVQFSMLLAVITIAFCSAASIADHKASHAETKSAQRGPHDGELNRAGPVWAEVVFRDDGVRIFLYDRKGKPVAAERIRGTATLIVKGNPRRYRYDMYPDTSNKATNSVSLPINLSRIPDGAMSASFVLSGLTGSRTVSFQQTFRRTLTDEQRAIAKQRICPVSGMKLGSMGKPIKTSVDGKDVFVCCAGCTNALKAEPAKFLARLNSVVGSPLPATKADAAAIAHQRKCPVMNTPLGKMGRPLKVRVGGREIFICCKGCTILLKKNPAKYLAMIPAPLPIKATKTDGALIARQRLCPVMDEPLNSMGGPWKIYAKGRPVFVCCKGCIKKIQTNPDFYLAKIDRIIKAGSQ